MAQPINELPVTSAREQFSHVVGAAQYAGRVTYVTKHGVRVAAIVPADMAEALEDEADVEAARAALDRIAAGGDARRPIPLREAIAELRKLDR